MPYYHINHEQYINKHLNIVDQIQWTKGVGKEVDTIAIVSYCRNIEKLMFVKDKAEEAHYEIIYYKYKPYLGRQSHITKIKYEKEKIKKGM